MITCPKCEKELPEGSVACNWCGASLAVRSRKKKMRGNGQGSVYRPSGSKTYAAAKTLGFETLPDGRKKQIFAVKRGFRTAKEAADYLPLLTRAPQKIDLDITFKGMYDLWLPYYERRGVSKSTLDCYKAAMKHYKYLWFIRFADIGIEDLQECIDDSERGKQTRKNMKTLAGLLYDYAIPRDYCEKNLGRFLYPGGEPGQPREEFSENQIETIRKSIGKVPYADYIYCHIYLGFRPHAFLMLDVKNYDQKDKYIIGGIKTEAGKNRVVTISPKIQPIIDRLVGERTEGPLFPGPDGNFFSDREYREEHFYPALDAMGFDNPKVRENGPRRYTPHCCRHTLATLMKRVDAPNSDKLALIGHASEEMLRYYEHTNISDLRKITDNL